MMQKSRLSFAQRLWKISFLIILFLILLHYYSKPTLSLFYTSRLQSQNRSTFHLTKFRNLSILIHQCEQLTTIDCLNYLHNNQSNYLQFLSPIESNVFRNQYCTHQKKILFHTFWSNPKTLNDPLLLLHIQSHLYTQNRKCSNLIIWTLPLFFGEIESKYQVHEPYLQFRTLRPLAKELRHVGVNIDSIWSWIFGGPPFMPLAVVSDAVRFVILHKFGGMYVDVDILLLRDLQPFYIHEFAYRWSTTDEFNTAVLQLHPQSNISSKLIDLAHKKQDPWIFFPTTIRSYICPLHLNRIPCVFFDPLWLAADGADGKAIKIWRLSSDTKEAFKTVFRKQSYLSEQGRTIFNGAFALHWHALHRAGMFEQGSFLDQWKQFFENHLLEKIR